MQFGKRSFIALAALLLVATPVFAQTLGMLTGEVTFDNAPLPGATVTISSPALQGTRSTTTDVNGNYNFAALPPGEYQVAFSMESMQNVTVPARITLGGTARADANMRLTTVAESITVTAAAPAVLETTEVQTNLQADLVEDLPIGRTIQATITLAPGVTTNGPGGALVVGGGYAYDTLYVINGAVTNENIRGQTDDLFIEDAIQETTIMTGGISAEYGRFTGGVVSAITKSGGNEFSGSLRDSFTDPSWDETTDAGEEQQDSVLNEVYEATLGGRIIRDRLWFFGAGRKAETSTPGFFINEGSPLPPTPRDPTVISDDRFEGKLTGQLTPKHTLVGSYLSYKVNQTPHCAFGCWEESTLDVNGRDLPREMWTGHYNGIITNNFLIEAGYSQRDLKFVGSGGEHVTTDFTDPRDIAEGTWAYDYTVAGGAWGAPIFCGVCDVESRENAYYNLKGTYYLATKGLGTHNIVGGYENFSESRFSNNYQSGSNFGVYTYYISPEYEDDGTFRPIISEGDILRYVPIEQLSQGSDFVTKSFYLNDKWDLNDRWSFNLGVRYDMNDGKDSSGAPISDDTNISPRLGLTYDIFGNGRFRANATYSKYVSRIQEGVGGGAGAGNPSAYIYLYTGPQIGGRGTGLDSFGVLEELFEWFLSPEIGGFQNTDNLIAVSIPGLNTRLDGTLQSPNVDEFTLGLGAQIGTNGFARVDYVDKTWNDFYTVTTVPNDQIENPFIEGQFLDFLTTENTNDFLERTYQALQFQGSYRLPFRINLGASYTYSESKGNEVGETAGSGPVASNPTSYREYKAFAQNNPIGFLPNDQTHRARIWASYDQPIGFLGNLNVSVLQRYDSGTPYSATSNVPASLFVDDPGYATPPATSLYFFSERGEYRTDDVTATDLALNWSLPLSKVTFFAQGEIINVFNEQAVVTPSTGIRTFAADGNTFNPFTETPLECPRGTLRSTCVAEGYHWQKTTFGQPTGPGSYQLPFTYRASVGLRF
jgi:outer membrane receptor protein involved in Fe transport